MARPCVGESEARAVYAYVNPTAAFRQSFGILHMHACMHARVFAWIGDFLQIFYADPAEAFKGSHRRLLACRGFQGLTWMAPPYLAGVKQARLPALLRHQFQKATVPQASRRQAPRHVSCTWPPGPSG